MIAPPDPAFCTSELKRKCFCSFKCDSIRHMYGLKTLNNSENKRTELGEYFKQICDMYQVTAYVM